MKKEIYNEKNTKQYYFENIKNKYIPYINYNLEIDK
jgi:hypothetical protein